MKPLISALVLMIGCQAFGQSVKVDPNQAEQFRRELRAAMDQNTKSLMNPGEHRAHGARLSALVNKSNRLFGGDPFNPKFGSCVKAVGLMQNAWQDQLRLLRENTSKNVGTHTAFVFEAGIEYWNCRMAIDALTPSIPDECLKRYDLSSPKGGELPRSEFCRQINP